MRGNRTWGMSVATAIQPSGLTSALAARARSTTAAWDLLLAVTVRDLRVRYQGTFFSYVWWIARPLALGLVLYFALGQVLRVGVPNYPVFLIAGLFPWFWFSTSIQQAAGSFLGNGGLIKKVTFPKLILPLSAVLFNTAQFLMTLPIIAVFVVVADGTQLHLVWLAGIPTLMAVQLLLLIGLGTLLASLNVFLRDIGPMLDVVLLLMFYLTGIIFPLERVPERYQWVIDLNPLAPLIGAWRGLFVNGKMPDFAIWPTLLLAVVALTAGLAIFHKLEKHFADAL